MKLIYKALVYSNIWVGVSVACLCYISMQPLFGADYGFLAFVMAATAFAYNYMRLVQLRGYLQSGNPNLKSWAREHQVLVWVYTLLFGGFGIYYFVLIYELRLVLFLALPAIISLLYPLSFKNIFSNFTSLRAVAGLKMLLISATWSYVTVLVPTSLYGFWESEVVIEFLMRTFLILGLVIPFDIRDLAQDDENMRTLPQQLGVDKAKQLAMFFITIYQLWLLIRVFAFGYSLVSAGALIVGFEVGYWLIKKSSPQRSESYFSFWLEGVPIFTTLLLVLLRALL